MTACMQPGCTGMIIDGYCDVCGSPAGAVPFVPAAVSAASPAPADEPGPRAVGGESGFPAKPKSGSPMTACTQPGCTGMIIDDYCDVCGSPAGAVPFVPAAVSAASPVPGLTAVPAPTPAPGPIDEEIPTQRIPRVKIPRQQSSAQEMTDPGAADPGADDAQQVDREKVGPAAEDTRKLHRGKELAEDKPNRALVYRTRVEEAQLPDDVREAALSEVGKLERTSDQSPESGDIQTWLDTILDLPWSTKTTDWIEDIKGSPEVEATLRRLINPAAADLEEGDTAEVPDLERADTAPAGPQQDDTVKMPAVPAVPSGGRHQRPQLLEQPVGPEPVQTPAKKRRFRYLALATTALAALLIGALLFAASRDRGVTAQSVPTVTATATATATKPTSAPTIQLEDFPNSARPFQTVRIEGKYPSGPDRFLQVQRWEGGEWLAFPYPARTDKSGKFTAFLELGQPGRYRIRLLDPDSGVTSKTFVLVIKG
jgi:hypothetical protein